jgi:hypothetical protein
MDNKMIEKMTTEELQEELERVRKSSSFADETWEKIFALEGELRKRGALPVYTYDYDR